MREVLIIGDSISLGYTPTVERELASIARVRHCPGNSGDSANLLANLRAWLAEPSPDLVVLNCGLHDVRRERDTGTLQVPLDRYHSNLRAAFETIRTTGCSLVWVTTTPVIEDRHQASKPWDRWNRDIDAYNAAALELAREAGALVIDLHAAARSLEIGAAIADDGVHFTPGAYEALGQTLATQLREILQCRPG